VTVHLTIITKTPEPGRVKTRLCPPCTPQQAADVAAAALADTIAAIDALIDNRSIDIRAIDVRRVILLDGPPGEWIPAHYDIVDQRGEADLGVRLANGFADLGAGVIIGMDTPACARWLGAAVDAVAAGDDAIGLTSDGGYWVIGLASIDATVFDGVPMSGSHTGVAQVRRLHQLGRRVRMLPMGRDLDTVDDLAAVAASNEDGHLPKMARQVLDN
jgi:glycosyltransferase A (GT-A) superfamily protein (DUF2064 family)